MVHGRSGLVESSFLYMAKAARAAMQRGLSSAVIKQDIYIQSYYITPK